MKKRSMLARFIFIPGLVIALNSALPTSAEVLSKFHANGTMGYFSWADSAGSVNLNVSRGREGKEESTYLSYMVYVSMVNGYALTNAYGNIPNSSLSGEGARYLHLTVDTSAVPGFTGSVCVFDYSTGQETCTSGGLGLIDVTWTKDRSYYTYRRTGSLSQSIGNITYHTVGNDESSYADIQGSILEMNVPPGVWASIGNNHNTSITIEKGSGNFDVSTQTSIETRADLLDGSGFSKGFGQPRPNASYNFKTVDVPGAIRTRFFAVNDFGDMVGGYRMPGDHLRGFLLRNGQMTAVDPPGSSWSQARGINNSGQIVGLFIDSTTGLYRGFLFSKGVYTAIDIPGATETYTLGIDAQGRMSGAYVGSGGIFHGFLMDGASITTIDCPAPAGADPATIPWGMTSTGQVVGNCDSTAQGGYSALIYRSGYLTLFDYPGDNIWGTTAGGTNTAGQIVGFYVDQYGAGHGFLKANNVFTTLDSPDAVEGTILRGINAAGVIVGEVDGGLHGLVVTPKNE